MVLQYRLRLYLVALILLSAFTGLLFRLWDVQITSQALYASQLSPTSKVTVRVPGVRGEIKDRNGETLVSNRLEYQLVLNLRVIVKDYDPAAHGRTERPKIARKTPRDDLRPNTKSRILPQSLKRPSLARSKNWALRLISVRFVTRSRTTMT